MNPKPEKCRKCGKPATHKITKIVKGKTHDIFLCDEHAQSFSPYLQAGKPQQSQLVELLQQVLKQQEKLINDTEEEEVAEGPEARKCPNCGLQFAAYRKTLLLGCSECYKAFEELLLNDMRKIHGAVSQNPELVDEHQETLDVAMEIESAAALTDEEKAVIPDYEAQPDEEEMQIGDLRLMLEKAIDAEDFQEAARLRDRIKEMEAKLQHDEEQDKA
ncbi:MAG: UvrB/UvrC motif-containing protein [Candidatus Sumerlaeota bacterium]